MFVFLSYNNQASAGIVPTRIQRALQQKSKCFCINGWFSTIDTEGQTHGVCWLTCVLNYCSIYFSGSGYGVGLDPALPMEAQVVLVALTFFYQFRLNWTEITWLPIDAYALLISCLNFWNALFVLQKLSGDLNSCNAQKKQWDWLVPTVIRVFVISTCSQSVYRLDS